MKEPFKLRIALVFGLAVCFTMPMTIAVYAACDPAVEPSCEEDDGGIIGGFINSAVEGLARAIREGSEFIIETTAAWWVNVDSIDLEQSPAGDIRGFILPISIVVAIAGMIWGGIRLAVRRKVDPAWDLGTGLIRLLAVNALFIAAPNVLLQAGDSFSEWVIDQAVDGDVVAKFGEIASLGGITAPGAIIFAGIIMILSGAVQAILMFLREGGIIILSGVLLLSAAGGFNPATKGWFPRVSGWLAALVLYKPVAALCYAAAFSMIGDDNEDPRTVFVGLTMLMLSIVALPAMMKFFSWAAPAAINSGGGGAGMAMAGAGIAAVAMSRGGGGGGGHDPITQSARIERDLGPSGAGSGARVIPPVSGGGGPAGATGAAGPSGAGAASPSASSAAAPAAATGGPAAAATVMAAQAAIQAGQAAKDKAGQGMTGGVT